MTLMANPPQSRQHNGAQPGRPTQATLVTAPNPGELSPIEAAVIDLCNELYELAGGRPVAPLSQGENAGEADPATAIRRRLLAMLEKYDASNAEDHPNPDWARPNQRALAMSALGDTEVAIELELDALGHADTPRRLEISLGNLADRCMRLGRYDEAVAFGLRAQEVAPGSPPVLLTLAQALHLAGFSDEADTVFAAFLEDPESPRPGTELWAYLESETLLAEMADELPALAALRDRWRGRRNAMDKNDTDGLSEGGRP